MTPLRALSAINCVGDCSPLAQTILGQKHHTTGRSVTWLARCIWGAEIEGSNPSVPTTGDLSNRITPPYREPTGKFKEAFPPMFDEL